MHKIQVSLARVKARASYQKIRERQKTLCRKYIGNVTNVAVAVATPASGTRQHSGSLTLSFAQTKVSDRCHTCEFVARLHRAIMSQHATVQLHAATLSRKQTEPT